MVTPTFLDQGEIAIATWIGETGNGGAVAMARWADKTIQSTGTGTVTVEGSSDGTNWDTCTTTPAVVTANSDTALVNENPLLLRVVCAGGTQTVTIVGVRS